MKVAFAGVLAAVGLSLSTTSLAAPENHWYAGASLGQSRVKFDDSGTAAGLVAEFGFGNTGFTDKDTDTAYKIFAGYRFNRNFALEGSYLHLGEWSQKTVIPSVGPVPSRDFEFKVHWKRGFSLAAVGLLPFRERFALFGKGGLYYAQTTGSTSIQAVGSGADSGSNTGIVAGAGLTFDLAHNITLRAEWERFFRVGGDQTGGKTDIDFLSVGLGVSF